MTVPPDESRYWELYAVAKLTLCNSTRFSYRMMSLQNTQTKLHLSENLLLTPTLKLDYSCLTSCKRGGFFAVEEVSQMLAGPVLSAILRQCALSLAQAAR